MSNKRNGAKVPEAVAAATVPAPDPAVPAVIAAAVEKAGGTVGPIVPAVQLTEFTITFPLDRLNSIIECMGGGPHRIVNDHIAFIQKQCQGQAEAAQAKANAEALAKQQGKAN